MVGEVFVEQAKPQTRAIYLRLASGVASGDVGSIWSWRENKDYPKELRRVSPEIVTAELGVIAIESVKRHSETANL